MTTISGSRLGRLVAARLSGLRGQLAGVAADAIDRVTRAIGLAVGAAVGEAVRLTIRATVAPPPTRQLDGPWDHPHALPPGVGTDPYPDDPDGDGPGPHGGEWDSDPPRTLPERDPWDDPDEYGDTPHADPAQTGGRDRAPGTIAPEPAPAPPPPEPSRGWWGRAAGVVGAIVSGRLTRASVAAGLVAGLVTLLPPGAAAVIGSVAAVLIA
jgi:hypothetical protein